MRAMDAPEVRPDRDPRVGSRVVVRHRLERPDPLTGATLTDAVGDRRTQNQPGTSTEYPNWQIPLSGPDGKPLGLEDLYHNEQAFRLAGIMNGFSGPLRLPRSEIELIVQS